MFGGGSLGLSAEARGLLRNLFVFDYMCAAEYEFGRIPEVLGLLAKSSQNLVAFEFEVPASAIKPGWWRDMIGREIRQKEIAAARAEGKKPPRAKKPKLDPIKPATFYAIGPKGTEAYVRALVLACASGQQASKGGHKVDICLDPQPGRDIDDLIGWMELDNGYLFFRDKPTWERTCALFGVAR